MNQKFVNILNDDIKAEISNVEYSLMLSRNNLLTANKSNNIDEKFANKTCHSYTCPKINSIGIYSDLNDTSHFPEKLNCVFEIKIQNANNLFNQFCQKNCIENVNCNITDKHCTQDDNLLQTIFKENESNNLELTANEECSYNLDEQIFKLIAQNLDNTYQPDDNVTNNCEKKILKHIESRNFITEFEKKPVIFKCFGNNQQYLKCNVCMNLFHDENSLDNHKCKPLVPHTISQSYRCNICDVTFSLEEHLIFHRQFHQNSSNFNCNICNIDFNEEQKLFHHYKRYHCNSIAVSCLQCGKLFDNLSQLRIHVCIDGKIRHHICEICNKGFTDGYTLKRHIVTHLPEKPFKCNQCMKSFTQKSRLNKHIADHKIIIEESQICWKCLECGKIFPTCEVADEHYKCHNNFIRLIEELSVTKIYHCEFCDSLFCDFQNLKIHQNKHRAEKLFNCTVCKIDFKSFSEAVSHWKGHPRVFKILTVFVCDVCEKESKELTLLYKHKKKRHHFTPKKSAFSEERLLYTCELCGNIFEKFDDIISHASKACSKFRCDTCGSRLPTAISLEAHKRRHNGLRPYACNICGKTYTQSSHMWTHKRFHMGVKPYACEYCDKKFTIKPDLEDHTRKKHTRERPFKCEVCNKTFLTGSVFYQHRLIHRRDRRFKCNYCQKAFTRTEALNNHVKIHTGEKPHTCSICGRCFRQKGDMKKHTRTQHDIKDDEFAFHEQNIASLDEIV